MEEEKKVATKIIVDERTFTTSVKDLAYKRQERKKNRKEGKRRKRLKKLEERKKDDETKNKQD